MTAMLTFYELINLGMIASSPHSQGQQVKHVLHVPYYVPIMWVIGVLSMTFLTLDKLYDAVGYLRNLI